MHIGEKRIASPGEEQYPIGVKSLVEDLFVSLDSERPLYLDDVHAAGTDEVDDPWQERADCIGVGSYAHVFKVETETGSLALKYFHSQDNMPPQLEAYKRADGLLHVVQLQGYSVPKGVLLMDCIANEIGEAPTECNDNQIRELIQAVVNMHRRGLGGELSPTNVLYNRTQGFTIIDYEIPDRDGSLILSVRSLDEALFYAINGDNDYSHREYSRLMDATQRRLERIITEHFPDLAYAHR